MSAKSTAALAHGSIRPWPTKTGRAIGLALVAALWLARSQAVAIGVFASVFLLAAADYFLARLALTQREVQLRPRNTTASIPDEQLRFDVAVQSGGSYPIRMIVGRIALSEHDSEWLTLQTGETEGMTALPATLQPRTAKHVRYRIDTSVFGLVWARQWSTQTVPAVAAAPANTDLSELEVRVTDDLVRLREYVPGDRMNHVSWPTTARTGRLHVRSSWVGDNEVTVVMDLGGLEEVMKTKTPLAANISVITLAAQVVRTLWEAGATVRLVTASDEWLIDSERDAALEDPDQRGRADLSFTDDWEYLVDGVVVRPGVVSQLVFDEASLAHQLGLAECHADMPLPAPPYVLVNSSGVKSI